MTSWRDVLLDALDHQPAVAVLRVVERHVKRQPTRAELSAARRAAGRLAETGQARLVTVPIRTAIGYRRHLLLIRQGVTVADVDLEQLAAPAADPATASPAARRVARLLDRIGADAGRVTRSLDGLTPEEREQAIQRIGEATELLREAHEP